MSYTRKFKRDIRVHYSGSKSVSYPASQSGGSMNVYYEGYATEEVSVEIDVETNPFDKSISNCNAQVAQLTNSVEAFNMAQCATIRENAEKVSKTIIDGFFQSVKSDISTQKMMLQQTVESRLMLLRQQLKTLQEKKEQMQKDYQRTSERYAKIFTDLNNELSSRIHKLDQPVFDLVKQVEQDNQRMLGSTLIHTVATHGKESGIAQAHLNMAKVKEDSNATLLKIHSFLEEKAISDATVRKATVEGNGKDTYYAPVSYISTLSQGGYTNSKCVIPEKYDNDQFNNLLKERMQEEEFKPLSDSEHDQIKSFVQIEMNEQIKENDPHSLRVKEMINKLLSKTKL